LSTIKVSPTVANVLSIVAPEAVVSVQPKVIPLLNSLLPRDRDAEPERMVRTLADVGSGTADAPLFNFHSTVSRPGSPPPAYPIRMAAADFGWPELSLA
jgi:hypothetical protein